MSRTLRHIFLSSSVALVVLALPASALAQTQMHLSVSRVGARQAVKRIVIDQAPSARGFAISCRKLKARKFRCSARWIETGADDTYRVRARVTLYLQTNADRTVKARTLVAHYQSYCQVHGSGKCFDLGTRTTAETWDTATSAYIIVE